MELQTKKQIIIVVGKKMGTLITRKRPIFKQKNKISKIPSYPMHLTELEIINQFQIDVIN